MTSEEQEQKILATFNMDEIDKQIEADTKWITFNAGDKKTLKFDPSKPIQKVESTYEGNPTVRYELSVVDVNTGTEKSWTVSRTLLQQLNDYIKEEIYTLTIQRHGTGKETRYMIKPVLE
jgi:hypothetical protein